MVYCIAISCEEFQINPGVQKLAKSIMSIFANIMGIRHLFATYDTSFQYCDAYLRPFYKVVNFVIS